MIESAKLALAFAEGREQDPLTSLVDTISHRGRPITEIRPEAKRRNSTAVLGEDCSKDLEIIASHLPPPKASE